VSQQQRDALDQLLRDAPLDLGGDVTEQRVIFEEMMAAIPLPADVTTSPGSLGGIPVVNVETASADHASVIFYLHGGAYAIGAAASSVGLASDLARRAGARLVTVDYRLAPEHPHPAAIDDAVAAYRGLLDSGVVRPRSRLPASPRVRAWPPRPWSRLSTPGYRNRAGRR
jgi:epsilon-lactone hydrolase